jgi:hypothetical protein
MKFFNTALLTLVLLTGAGSVASAESLGNVVRDSIRGELRDGVRDSVRRTVCPPGQRPDGRGVCNTLEDVDNVTDSLRRGRNTIRAIDAIF